MKKSIKKYHKICNKIVKKFAKKQEIEFDYWIGDKIGEIASFSESYFFNLNDIILDFLENMKPGFIIK